MRAIHKFCFISGMGLLLVAGAALGQGNERAVTAGSSNDMRQPAAVIEKTSRRFIEALRLNKPLIEKDPREAQRLVRKYILPHFDLAFTTRLVLGRYWKSATPLRRKEFSKAFINHLVAVYEKGIENYSKDRVQVLPLQGGRSRQFVSVDTLVHIPGNNTVPVDYAMHKVNGSWKIFDVEVMHISFVLTYRNEYQAEIKKTSLGSLIEHLRKSQIPGNHAASTPSSAS